MPTRLGLDIGTNSIGWWLYQTDGKNIVDNIDGGVRIFSDGRDAKSGASPSGGPTGGAFDAAEAGPVSAPSRRPDAQARRGRLDAQESRGGQGAGSARSLRFAC